MKKCISVLLYLVLVVVFLGFDIRKLVDLRQMFLVFAGAAILYIPSVKDSADKKIDKDLIGQNTLWASLIQTFVLFFSVLVNSPGPGDRYLNTALSCRPLLYGFCVWVILHDEDKKDEDKKNEKKELEGLEEVKEVKAIKENNIVQKEIPEKEAGPEENGNVLKHLPGIDECRQRFLQAGLTKRETEVAVLVLKCMSNAEIAEELFISETTVKKHMSNIFAKLKINKREQIRNIFY